MDVSLPASSIQVVQFQDNVVSYTNATWSVPYILTGNIDGIFNQLFVTYLGTDPQNPSIPLYTATFGGSSGQPANYFYTSTKPYMVSALGSYGDALASPNGLFGLVLPQTGGVALYYLAGANQLKQYWHLGTSASTSASTLQMYFNMSPPSSTGNCSGENSPWLMSSPDNKDLFSFKDCARMVGLQNNGSLVVYNQNNGLTYNSTGYNPGDPNAQLDDDPPHPGKPPGNLQPVAFPISNLNTATVLGTTPVLTASGTVTATLYSANGGVVNGIVETMTAQQQQEYCAGTAPPSTVVATPTSKTGPPSLTLQRSQYRQAPRTRVNVKARVSESSSGMRFFPGPPTSIQGTTVPPTPRPRR
jgi:hypothetical protein